MTTSVAHCGSCANPCGGSCIQGVCVTENCTNGIDDDLDGLVDCADTDCNAGFTCVPEAPMGWTGPVLLYEGSPALKPSCGQIGAADSFVGSNNLQAPNDSCSACSCKPQGVVCTAQALSTYSDQACTTVKPSIAQPAAKACVDVNVNPPLKSYAAAPPTTALANASCSPEGGVLNASAPSWNTAALACAPSTLGSGCGAANVCALAGSAPFGSGACVWQSGVQACPAGYPVQHTYYTGTSDTRACAACACSGVPSGSCKMNTEVYGNTGCGGLADLVANDGGCHKAQTAKSIRPVADLSGITGCAPSGGELSGTLTPNGDTTVCCTQ
jgi:hypothetical protein